MACPLIFVIRLVRYTDRACASVDYHTDNLVAEVAADRCNLRADSCDAERQVICTRLYSISIDVQCALCVTTVVPACTYCQVLLAVGRDDKFHRQ